MQLNSLFTFLGMNASSEADVDTQGGAQQKSSGFGAMLASTLAMLSQKGGHDAATDSNLVDENGNPGEPTAEDGPPAFAGLFTTADDEKAPTGTDILNTGPGANDETAETKSSDLSAGQPTSEESGIGPLLSPSNDSGVDERHRHATQNGEGDGADEELLKRSADSGSGAGSDFIPEERVADGRARDAAEAESAPPVRYHESAEEAIESSPTDRKIRLDTPSETPESNPSNDAGKGDSADASPPSDADLQTPDQNTKPANDTFIDKRRGSAPIGDASTPSEGDEPASGNRPLQSSDSSSAASGSMEDAEANGTQQRSDVSDEFLRPNTSGNDTSAVDEVGGRRGESKTARTSTTPPPATDPTPVESDSTTPSKFNEHSDDRRISTQSEAESGPRREASADSDQRLAATDRQRGTAVDGRQQNSAEQAERLRVADLERASHRRPAERITVWQEASTTSTSDLDTAETSATRLAEELKTSAQSSTTVDPKPSTDGAKEATATNAAGEAKPGTTTESTADAKIGVKAESTAEAKAGQKAKPAPDVKAGQKAEPAPDVKAQQKAEPAPDVKAQQKAEPAPDVKAQQKAEPAPDVKAQQKAEPTGDAKDPKAETSAAAKAKPNSDAKTATRANATADAKIGTHSDEAPAPKTARQSASSNGTAKTGAEVLMDTDNASVVSDTNAKDAEIKAAADGRRAADATTTKTNEQASASAALADDNPDRETRTESDRSSSRTASGENVESGNLAKGEGGTQNDFMAGSDAQPRDAFDVAADELNPEAVEFDAALQDEFVSVDAEIPVDVQSPESTEKMNFTPERAQSTASTSSNPLGEAARAARPRQAGSLNWMRAMLDDSLKGLSLEDDWKVLEMKLDEGQGTMTVRARRDEEKVSISVNFSDPQLRALAIEQADRLQETLRAQYATQVDFSLMNDNAGHSQHRHNGATRDGGLSADGLSPNRTQSVSSADRARATRAALAGARNEWIG